jgi:GNAT superfamily N-acetyltransferase
MRIRFATVDDAAGIARVHVRSWQVAYRGTVPQDHLDGLDPVARAEHTRALLASLPADTGVLVATDDAGAVVGFVNYGGYRDEDLLHSTEGEIRAIYAEPGQWGAGLGRELMTAALRELSAQGRNPVRLWVLSANERARRFYALAGFVPDGTTSVFRVERGTDPPVDLDEVRYVFDDRAGGVAGVG